MRSGWPVSVPRRHDATDCEGAHDLADRDRRHIVVLIVDVTTLRRIDRQIKILDQQFAVVQRRHRPVLDAKVRWLRHADRPRCEHDTAVVADHAAIPSKRRAAFKCGMSNILPSIDTAPAPDAKASTTRRASASSSPVGVNAALMISTWSGWIATRPVKPSCRAAV